MEAKRVAELIKAANERLNGAPGARGITLLPEEVLELFNGVKVTGEVVEATEEQVRLTEQPVTGGLMSAAGRIAAAFITKQPPMISSQKVADYTSEILLLIESRLPND